ncbi:Extracellular matrix-binding protein ebh [Mycoplasmopsis anatis]|uniref:GA module-containing protein n=1 Tax=Mycoplasmopsis anatis TaxID=171279 RepID=UPI001C4DF362|nr:GA module-containing protein [Mycoplasmopsis anatis]MBW0595047.1 Extracellular matrix-binding protein ebh [Mycoplasmopsis anatis]MBW0601621.1 Extracellular matrix-binding protein ebh [Mycoplasmopsis anatis]MBW0603070.1 Extracellular matrix-binding protein ebh [Mycoplasmopsis anatis]
MKKFLIPLNITATAITTIAFSISASENNETTEANSNVESSSSTTTDLETKKKDFNNWIDTNTQVKDLNETQKTAFKEKVNAITDTETNGQDTVDSIKSKAIEISKKMSELKVIIDQYNAKKGEQNYQDSSVDVQNSFDEKIDEANKFIQTTKLIETQENDDFYVKGQQIKEAYEQLNGTTKLKSDIKSYIKQINDAEYINNAQKKSLEEYISQSMNIEDAFNRISKLHDLVVIMTQLNRSITSLVPSATKSDYYLYGNDDIKTSLDSISTEAKNLLDKDNGENKTYAEVALIQNSIISKIRELRNDYNTRLSQAKTNVNDALDKAAHLSETTKESFKQEMNSLKDPDATNELVNKINSLNEKAGMLKEKIELAQSIKSDSLYHLIDESIKTELNDSISKSQNHIDQLVSSSNNEEINLIMTELEQKIEKTKQKISEIKEKINTAKGEISNLDSLNEIQKQYFINKLSNINSLDQIEQIVQEAKSLQQGMQALKEVVTRVNEVANTSNYTESDNKDQIDGLVSEYNTILNSSLENFDSQNLNKVNELKTNLETALDSLNGDRKIQDKKDELKEKLDSEYMNLNNVQENDAIAKINQANSIQELENLDRNLRHLNYFMSKLSSELAKTQEVMKSQNYLNSDENLKNELNELVQKATLYTDKKSNDPEKLLSKEQVRELINNLNTKTSQLNGDQKAKKSAIDQINNLDSLNAAQKNNYINQINFKDSLEDVKSVLDEAKELNSSMKKLIDLVQVSEQLKNTDSYNNASEEIKSEINAILEKAKELIKSDSTHNATKVEVDKLYEQLNSSLSKLSNNTLEDKINLLRKLANEKNEVTQSNQFNNSTQTVKDSYLNAIKKAENLLNKNNPTEEEIYSSINEILNSKKQFSTSTDSSNQADLDYIQSLGNLNATEKSFFVEQIKKAANREQIENIKGQATTLNNDKTDLISQIDSLNNLSDQEKNKFKQEIINHTSELSIPVSSSYKSELDKIILEAMKQNLLNKINNSEVLNESEKQYFTQKVQDSDNKDSLNIIEQSIDSIISKKQEVNNSITSKENLNDKEKQALLNKINARDLSQVEDLEHSLDDIINTANSINQMKQDAKNTIDSLNNIDKTQKDQLKEKISNVFEENLNSEAYSSALNSIINTSNEANKLMQQIINELSQDKAAEELNSAVQPLINKLSELDVDTTLINKVLSLANLSKDLDTKLDSFRNSDANNEEQSLTNKKALSKILVDVNHASQDNLSSTVEQLNQQISTLNSKINSLKNNAQDEININDYIIHPLNSQNLKENINDNQHFIKLLEINNYEKLFDDKVSAQEKKEIISKIKNLDLSKSMYSNINKTQLMLTLKNIENQLVEPTKNNSTKTAFIAAGIVTLAVATLGISLIIMVLRKKKNNK